MIIFIRSSVWFDTFSLKNGNKQKYIIGKCKHALVNYNWIRKIFKHKIMKDVHMKADYWKEQICILNDALMSK